jgi:hypothetical protein
MASILKIRNLDANLGPEPHGVVAVNPLRALDHDAASAVNARLTRSG